MTRILIIGGSDAGISAALRAHELDPTAEVRLIVLADEYPNFSDLWPPYFISRRPRTGGFCASHRIFRASRFCAVTRRR